MRAAASAEQLYDLERQVRALAEEVDEARRIIPELRALLRKVASRTTHAMACERSDADDCSCGALPGERAALLELRQYIKGDEA